MNKDKLLDWLRKKKKELSGPGGCSVLHEAISAEKVKLIREIIQHIQSEPEETLSIAEICQKEQVRFIHNNPPVPGEKTVFDAITESPELLAVFLSNTCQTLTEAYNRKFGKEILYDYKESKDKFLEHLNQKAGE